MTTPLRKAVVLGAGTMGAQVAAHLVGCGLEVALLDIVPKDAPDRSALARRALEVLKKLKPSPLQLPDDVARIRPGNFEDDWDQLKDADWVFEAVVEDLAIKRALFERVAATVKPGAVVTTNTSGLPLTEIAAELPEAFRRRFLGTHFFNPPRYLKLLETIPGPGSDPELVAAIERFGERVLGKGVVRCKDTPNFIGNRVGAYSIGVSVRTMVEMGLSVEAVDALTGPVIGRPKSATFRTADIAGVDVVAKVSEHLYDAVPQDPGREMLKLPAFVGEMLKRGWLGEKKGVGFYRKEGKEILALDWRSLEHKPRGEVSFDSVKAAAKNEDAGERTRQILLGHDEAAEFLWRTVGASCLYAASLVPEISDDVWSVDRAMEWGYGWGLGPFRLMDAIGVHDVAERARASGWSVPPLVTSLLASGRRHFYEPDAKTGGRTAWGPKGVVAVAEREGVVDLAALHRAGAAVKRNAGASLVDLGDGVGLVEFHSKMNTLGADALEMLHTAVHEARAHFDALVVGNQGEQFSAGANLMLVLGAASAGRFDEIDQMVRRFQDANMALKYADVPVVAAPFGLTLGGGCEISLHATRVRLSAETYMGLVELGVGLVPAGGGTKEMALRALDRCAGVKDADPFPFLKAAFDLMAFAKVSGSGAEARRLFLTPADSVSPNPDRLIGDAKALALVLARLGQRPGRPRTDIPALGRPALATFKMGIYNAVQGGHASEHDALLASHVATILCGGDRPPGLVSEQQLLDLEREAFVSLCGTDKTRARIEHMLKTGKPLRN